MNHRETLEFLKQRGNEVQTMHLGLHRTLAMMQALGEPQNSYASIHIAGTNGKGSVAAMAESILHHAGYRTGLFTSPHLVRVEERFRINGRRISPRRFAALATRIQKIENKLLQGKKLDRYLTTFEFLACCALLHFAEEKVDIAVFEVGLGGKLDATNVIHPLVSVITRISYDHQHYLGNSLTKISGEKAGIIKKGVPVISGCRETVPRRVIRSRAKKVGAPLLESFSECRIQINGEIRGRYSIDLQTPQRHYRNLRLPLAGEYQAQNAALAIMAIESLESFPVKPDDIRRGMAGVHWLGRLDEYKSRRRTLLDGAHNPDAAQKLRDYLIQRKETEVHFVFGAVQDKNIREIGAFLFPVAASIHLTPLTNTRTASTDEIADRNKRFRSKMKAHPSMRRALAAAWEECSPKGLVVVTGSLYLVGELLPVIQKHTTPIKKKK
ncbi:MAG: bifunctional folylpolyglutamate synthase/dihydrofolate synthase [Acidobacteria bacterium]|nr:bifunctional folylpolyglutamate synthase/dihydrofolate synthase [Acidobacteriota bacterium]